MLGLECSVLGMSSLCWKRNVEMIADEVFCRMPNNGSQRRRPAATNCYGQTHDVLNQSLERRDVLCFHNEYSDEVE